MAEDALDDKPLAYPERILVKMDQLLRKTYAVTEEKKKHGLKKDPNMRQLDDKIL